jgi:hypothetical protein
MIQAELSGKELKNLDKLVHNEAKYYSYKLSELPSIERPDVF